ncbi:hypothetical protein ABKV19_006761 [Rosa sericea]
MQANQIGGIKATTRCLELTDKVQRSGNSLQEYMRKHDLSELLIFNFDSISIATNNFSITNKLEEGGFGPVIHRDLKVSNILLDEKMNPKISDFGLAHIVHGTDLENRRKVVGTPGYMSPEYAMGGIFSEKSDVYSFGVLVLEIISSKKNSNFYYHEQQLGFLTYDDAADRLIMPEVVFMLSSETDAPQPKQPIFAWKSSVPQLQKSCSTSDTTITMILGR